MGSPVILRQIRIRNFKLFRHTESFELGVSTYLVGVNSSGKTTVLQAIRYFFDDGLYQSRDFLNQTEMDRRQTGSRISEIAVTFDVAAITKKRLRDALTKNYGKTLEVNKLAKLSDTGVLEFSYEVVAKGTLHVYKWEDLPAEIKELMQSIKVNYIHPQRGAELLEDAQVKLRRRLLDNWGRARAVTNSMRELEAQWGAFRTTATQYLSESLQSNIRRVWPEGEVNITLPKDIKEILAISDISFSGYKGSPSVDLLNQGSGAQSLILYFTHYMLDIDRTAHRAAEYHPLWLLEEPESFMHADLVSKFASEINSDAWTGTIPLVISTHSSILLSRSRTLGPNALWHNLALGEKPKSKSSDAWSDKEIDDLGKMMGDANFKYYFEAARNETIIYTEDEKPETIDSYVRSGINVTKSLRGISAFKQMVATLIDLDKDILSSQMIVIVDNDDGFKEVRSIIEPKELAKEDAFTLYRVKDLKNAYALVLPEGWAAEDLFDQLDAQLEFVVDEIFQPDLTLKHNPSARFSALVTKFRRTSGLSRDEIKKIMKNHDEFKDYFWQQVDDKGWKVATKNTAAILSLIEQAN